MGDTNILRCYIFWDVLSADDLGKYLFPCGGLGGKSGKSVR